MWCPSCAEVIRLILLREKGVRQCIVDYTTDLAMVEYSPRNISKDTIAQLIRRLGYVPQPLQGADRKPVSFSLWLRFVISAFCALNIMMFSYPIYGSYFTLDDQGYTRLFAWLSFFTSLPVVTYCFWPIIQRFINTLRVGIAGMETLVLLGVTSAFTLSIFELANGGVHVYFDSMSVIISLVLLGKIIESKAKFSSKDSLLRIARSTPKRARKCFPDGSQKFVPVKEIAIGDLLTVFSGEKFVLDGVVKDGEGGCDESLLTGEAIPVRKMRGDSILGGTFLQNGSITYHVTTSPDQTALNKIIEIVERDIGHKSSYIRAADKITRVFVPVIIALAFIVGFATFLSATTDPIRPALLRAISILLISCPCAIGIAAPIAEAHIMRGLANLGALVRNRGCLAVLDKITVFAFDKTGTITEGQFHVREGLEGINSENKAALKALASNSNHPIAAAINLSLATQYPLKMDRIEEFAGKGLKGTLDNHEFFLGSKNFLRSQSILDLPPDNFANEDTATIVYFAKNKHCLACIKLGDQIREGAQAVIQSLKGIQTVLLSGDGENSVKATAKACDFGSYQSSFHPLQKRDYIESQRKQGHIVAMLGDGINDAPALTAAHIGISVVSASDISIQVSDLLLTTDKLSVIPKIRGLASKGQRIIKQNLFWAFFYNIIGIGLAACGYLTPLFAAFAMVTSSSIVIFNAKRLD